MKTETKIRIYGLTLIVISTVYFALYVKANEFPGKVANEFFNGQILAPDYVHSDSIVVINADLLNEQIPLCEGSDESISDLLGEGCVNIEDYQDYITTVIAIK